jgi:hypothetical protein
MILQNLVTFLVTKRGEKEGVFRGNDTNRIQKIFGEG